MRRVDSLRRRMLLGLLGYAVVLTVLVSAHGLLVNESAERLLWQALLESELDQLASRMREDPGYRWADSHNMALYGGEQGASLPAAVASLAPGLHDEIMVDGVERVVLVRNDDGRQVALALDITDIERRELNMSVAIIGSAVVMIGLIGLFVAWGVGRMTLPLSRMAEGIHRLQPDRSAQRVELPRGATTELAIIGEALNDYLHRNDRFVERERAFIGMASHELRTPIAVIAGASEIALQDSALGASRKQVQRIRNTALDMEALVNLLLVLARDPARLATLGETISLKSLLEQSIEDHAYLVGPRDLSVELSVEADQMLHAPLAIVRAAVGNLLRNAIENSDRGRITVSLAAPATVCISDPGHGMTPEEISAIYARNVRGGKDRPGGIGLDLVARLCEHFGWSLEFQAGRPAGTTVRLRFGR